MSIQEEIDKLEKEKFYLAMKDHWSHEDYEYDRQLHNRIWELKLKIREGEV